MTTLETLNERIDLAQKAYDGFIKAQEERASILPNEELKTDMVYLSYNSGAAAQWERLVELKEIKQTYQIQIADGAIALWGGQSLLIATPNIPEQTAKHWGTGMKLAVESLPQSLRTRARSNFEFLTTEEIRKGMQRDETAIHPDFIQSEVHTMD